MNTQDPRYGARSEDGRYWWDGDAWELVSSEPYSQPIPQHASKNRKMNTIILSVVGGVLGLFLIVGVVASIGQVSDKVAGTDTSSSGSNWPPQNSEPAPDPTPDSDAANLSCALFFKDDVTGVLQGTLSMLNEGQVYFETGDVYGAIAIAPRMQRDWKQAEAEFAELAPGADAACEGSTIGPEMLQTIPHLEQYASDWATSWSYVASGDIELAVPFAQSATGELEQANAHLENVSDYVG